MTPAQAIAALDRQINAHGQTITLRRGPKSAPTFLLQARGFVTGFKAEELVAGSGISQNDDKVIISPTVLAGWPDPLPGEDDWCEIGGQFRAVVLSRARKINDTTVRIELQVRG